MKRIAPRSPLKSYPSAQSSGRKGRSNDVDAPGNDKELESKRPSLPFPVVGIGASAGGLEAFMELLKHLPTGTGMGFVLVQHLDPQHESALPQLLARATSMPVREVTNNLQVEANHVYIIPPNTNLALQRGILKLRSRPAGRKPARSIDFFFESLAQDQGERSIGVILSGTATDGTIGLEAIKAEGGIAFAQDESARYDSMPRNAAAAGCVDFVLPPQDIARELARIAKHPCIASHALKLLTGFEEKTKVAGVTPWPSHSKARMTANRKAAGETSSESAEGAARPDGGRHNHGYGKILSLLRGHSGVDFSSYKPATMQRRIARRMVLGRIETLAAYADYLQENSKELETLYSDFLISVTNFFRNPEAFEVLKRRIFRRLLQQRKADPFRVWVLGCSTGQEAYSIAMAFMEEAEKFPGRRKLQIFATDLNDALLDRARNGLYARNLVQDVSPERLRRFFVEEEGGYRVAKQLREMVIFARQNLTSDPPFSRMDLISCRNLLIYLDADLQKKALPTFHYALKPEGVLFLGASESVGGFTDLFEPVDKKQKIYARKPAPTPAFHLPVKKRPVETGRTALAPRRPRQRGSFSKAPEGFRAELSTQLEADRVTVNQFAPPGVLISEELQILQFRGPTNIYLQPPAGKASFDVLKMTREGLMLPLRSAINKARKENKIARRENVRFGHEGKVRRVNLVVVPLKNLKARCFLVLFEDIKMKKGMASGGSGGQVRSRSFATKKDEPSRVAELESELAETRDYLQAVQEQHEAANEELQASNEEVTSANEELQSVNEELETSKEELESTNEELTTVNEEMSHRNAELSRLNADLNNLQNSARLSVILVGRDLTIRRFSPAAGQQFSLRTADVGQPLGKFRHDLLSVAGGSQAGSPLDLEAFTREVIDSVRERECESRDRDGRWFRLRVHPYLTLDNKIDGAVIVFTDIDALKRTERAMKAARDYAEATLRTARDPFVVLRSDLRVNSANEAFYKTFEVPLDQTEGRLIYELGNHQWDIPRLRMMLEDILPRNSHFNDFEVVHDFPQIGKRTMLLNARRLNLEDGSPPMVLLSIEDVTERIESRSALRASEIRYRRLFETASDGILILDSVSRKITDANPFMLQLLDCTRQELVGRELWEIGLVKDEPTSRAVFRQLQKQTMVRYDDLPLKTRKGAICEVEVIANNYVEDGVQVIQCNIRDMTGRKQEEETRARLSALVEFSEDAIVSKDLNGIITSWNRGAERLFGYTEREAVGQSITMLIPPNHADEEPAILERIRRGEAVQHYETVRRRKDGSLFDISLTVSPIRNSQGEIIGASKIARDVTKSKRSEAELAESLAREKAASRAKDDFMAALSHELRTPLNPVLLLASDSASDPDLPEHVRANFDSIRKNVELEARLIDDLLDLTRITHGKLVLNQAELDVHGVLNDAISTVFNEIERKQILLKLDLRADRHKIFGDAVRLQQILWNVLKNAVKFTYEGGQIIVESQTLPGDKILINITDTGIGMNPGEIEHIFDAFAQGTHHFGGLGLGLAISRVLVELHFGSIYASSRGKGRGARFSIELPLVKLSEKQESAGVEPPSIPGPVAGKMSGQCLHVLLVEDHESTRSALSQLLVRRSHKVTTASSFAQAHSLIAENEDFNLLISDIGLPDGSGCDLMNEFQKKFGAHGIALTGYGAEGDIAKSQTSGFSVHLTKPIRIDALERAIADAM